MLDSLELEPRHIVIDWLLTNLLYVHRYLTNLSSPLGVCMSVCLLAPCS